MPTFLANIHDHLIENFILSGTSTLIKSNTNTFMNTENEYIKPIKVYLDFSIGHVDDFVMIATILNMQK